MHVNGYAYTFIMHMQLQQEVGANIIVLFSCRKRELQSKSKVMKRLPLRRGEVSGRLSVPDHIPKPPYVNSSLLPEISSEPQSHDSEGIARMKAACELAARVLDYAGTLVRVRTSYFISEVKFTNSYEPTVLISVVTGFKCIVCI